MLPLAEIAGRRLLNHGIPGSIDYVRHLTLWLTLVGAIAAAREGRHLAMTTTAWLPARLRPWAEGAAAVVACTVSLSLAWTSLQLVLAERDSAMTLAGGVPIYVAQAILPVGFAIVARRLALRAPGRASSLSYWRRALVWSPAWDWRRRTWWSICGGRSSPCSVAPWCPVRRCS